MQERVSLGFMFSLLLCYDDEKGERGKGNGQGKSAMAVL